MTLALLRTGRDILEYFPTILFFEFLGLHPQSLAISTNFVLESGNHANRHFFLLATKAVRSANHFRTLHGLSMPVITVKATLEMGVTFRLQEIIVLAFLRQVLHVVVLAVVANLFDHGAHRRLVFTDQLGVLDLFMFQNLDRTLLFGQGAFKFGDASRCSCQFPYANKLE